MKNNIFYLSFGVVMLAYMSCVPARQVEEIKAQKQKCEEERNSLAASNKNLETENTELKASVDDLKKSHQALVKDTTVLGTSLRKMQLQYDKINALNDELLKKQSELRKGSQEENAKLVMELDKMKTELQKKEDGLKQLERELEAKKENLDKLNSELEKREKRVKELEDVIAQKDAAVNALKDKVSNALLGFKEKGLSITQKDGKIYVSLEAELLFAKGSTVVDSKGKSMLTELAKVLADNKDIQVLVEGHTDTDKMSGGSIKDNWDLSVLRATSVVRILMENKNLESARVTAAGRGEFVPVDNGTTESAKSKNRRIEVILIPNLDALFQIIDNK
jgi:chemotaxis protein MotB